MKNFRVKFEDGGEAIVEAETLVQARQFAGMAFPKRIIKRILNPYTKKASV